MTFPMFSQSKGYMAGGKPILFHRFRTPVTPALLAALLCFLLSVQALAATVADLHDFNPSAGDPNTFNSTRPAQGRDGNFYAESRNGGTANQGTVFSVSRTGTVKVILNFNGTNGSFETGGVTLGTDGQLYGNTFSGGTHGDGVTFKVTLAGGFTALHNFTNTGDGINPVNALVIGNDGNFYGLTDSNPETFYKVTPAGVLTTLHTFTTAQGFQGGQLSLGSDGNFYGGLNLGGAHNFGTAFKVTPTGALTILHNFTNADGTDAATGMVQAGKGAFYGTASIGGTFGGGVVYKLTSAGAYTVLHNLVPSTDGSLVGVPTLATDGNIYGVAINDGGLNCGTIFKVTPAGAFSVVYTFDSTHGCNPEPYLTQGTDGRLYGLTNAGGAHGSGTFFRLDVGLAPFASLLPTSGKVGSKIGVLGQGFTTASVVKFNGVQATAVTLSGSTFILATVPAGATDGFVTVTTGTTKLTSAQKFIVHNSWGHGKVIPTPVAFATAAVLNQKIYLVGGYPGTTYSGPVGNNQIYNPAANTWSSGSVLPIGTAQAATAVVNNTLYIFGGTTDGATDTNAVWAYNPATNTWSSKMAMPTARRSIAAAAENGIIYVIGGYRAATNSRLSTVEAYNPATNSWTEKAPLLEGKSEPMVGLIGTTIVAADGYNGVSDSGDNEGYNAATNNWVALNPDPKPRNGACGGAIGLQLYVAGGGNGATSVPSLTSTESFTLSNKSWITLASMPQGSAAPGSAVYNGQLYCFGGWASAPNGSLLNSVQIYQP
jgi:uncharacterized repeat protein (TIGR03803 family)